MKPRVLHVVKSQNVAGAENHLFMLLRALAADGWDVHLLSLADRRHGPMGEAYRAGLDAARAAGVGVHLDEVAHKLDARAVGRIARHVRRVAPDLVHTHMPYADLFGSVAARLAGVRAVIGSRHHDCAFSRAEWLRFRAWYALVRPFQRAVIAISGRVAEQCREMEGWAGRDVHPVLYGCEDHAVDRAAARAALLAELGLPDDALLLGTVARLIPWKGHRHAVAAMARLAGPLPRARWLFAGDGPERAALERQVAVAGLAERVRFLGYRRDVAALMAAFDVLVHPTLGEGFGLIQLEAMLQGTPIVATRTGAIPEVVDDGRTGVLVPPGDPAALADALARLAADPELRRRLGVEGRRRYEREFTVERMARETGEVYARVLAAAPGRAPARRAPAAAGAPDQPLAR
jgi:glycosyltransferase involved in cell wall biosynthesis